MSMDFSREPSEAWLRVRLRQLNPFAIANPLVRRLVLIGVSSVVTLVALTSHREVPNYAEPLRGQKPIAKGELPRDFLYDIPRGDLDPHAPVEFASHWGAAAHSMAQYPNHPWAGKYVRRNQSATDEVLIVSPESGFAGHLSANNRDKRSPEYVFGRLTEQRGQILLSVDSRTPNDTPKLALYPVAWGGQHYLLDAEEVERQRQIIAQTGKADEEALAKAFIRAGEQNEATAGVLNLPNTQQAQ